ncbi:MAG: GntR family transcriptional regulator [Pseudomonadota bacterium]
MKKKSSFIVFETLEKEIISGIIKDGERLDEVKLSERFFISRTPIREALVMLASSGLAEQIPRRGCFVRHPSIQELIEMFEVMAELEGMCGRLAARRIMPEQMLELENSNSKCEKLALEGDTDAYYAENATFHSIIYAASYNSFLASQAKALHNRLKTYRRIQLQASQRLSQSLSEHSDIVIALKNGDSQMAESILKEHILIQGEKFNDIVAKLQLLKSV